MATKPKPKAVSKKTPTAAASKKAGPTASKKVAVKKVAAKKAPLNKAAKKAPGKDSRDHSRITVTVPLAYTVGTLGVKDGVVSLTIDGVPYPFKAQMNIPVCLLYPRKPQLGRDAEYLKQLKAAAKELKRNVIGVKGCATCC